MNVRSKNVTEKYVYPKGSTHFLSYQYDFFPHHITLPCKKMNDRKTIRM